MAQPIWVTNAGDLGTIPEGVFYQIPLKAYDPADPNNADAVYYKMIAGQLPKGVQCTKTGLIIGTPQAIASLQGVPYPVSRNITSTFAVRAYTERTVNGVDIVDRLADRTFSITVSGQNDPEFVTPAGNIGTFYDGSVISIQIETKDNDADDPKIVKLIGGELPQGLTLSPSGLISGFIDPLVPIGNMAGYSRDNQGFDKYPFDFSKNSASKNYQFTLEVTDGKTSAIRTFEIYVYSRDSMTADTIDFTADNTFITADETPVILPFIENASPSNLGTHRSDNFFAYQFIGIDLNGDTIEFISDNSGPGMGFPPGLQLDLQTGWLYGFIPDMGATENTYNFGVIVRKANYAFATSQPYYFSMTVIGQISTEVIWISPPDLGTIVNGSTSVLQVEAYNTNGRSLQYQLKPGGYPVSGSGVYNKLPQGLRLLSDGTIAGRVSFNTFALDGGTTTFDSQKSTRLEVDPTTFDLKYTFTVNAYSSDSIVNAYKTFTVTVDRVFNEPYENLYVSSMPPLEDRAVITSLLQNQDLIPTDLVFRPNDPNFGVSSNVIYYHAFGLKSSTLEEYVSSLYINHYWKNLTLGSVNVAQATNASGKVIYEVVYCKIVDDLVNNQDLSVSKQVTLPYQVNPGDISTVYPNSLINMRDQVIDVIGQVSKILPTWMLSKQANGQVLGFTPAWVICYAKPGYGKQIAYNINQKFDDKLNRIDFKVDRYELDRLLSIHWDPLADSVNANWYPTPAETTFDAVPHYQITGITPGNDYVIGDQILILGSVLGGETNINNQIITVQEVDTFGGITLAYVSGQGPLFSEGNTYSGITGTNISGIGNGAAFDFEVSNVTLTVFDGTSLRFEQPVDNYTNTDEYNKYLVFPRRNILA
jgi:hypothetical protein